MINISNFMILFKYDLGKLYNNYKKFKQIIIYLKNVY